MSYQNTSTAQVVESRGLCFASERVESKLAKYKTAMEEEGAEPDEDAAAPRDDDTPFKR